LLLAASALPELENEDEDERQSRLGRGLQPAPTLSRKLSRALARGSRRMAVVTGRVAHSLRAAPGVSRVADEVQDTVVTAKEFVSDKVEDVANVTLDAAGHVVRKTLRHRLQHALGFF
ncbi:hypothetical protein HaLaN_30534, partial [Haematococcus lacustris]